MTSKANHGTARSVQVMAGWVVWSGLMLAGCSTVKLDNDVPVETRNPVAAKIAAPASAPADSQGQSRVASVDLTKSGDSNGASVGSGRVIYFDFDSDAIKDEFRPVVDNHAKLLVADRKKHVQVQGHTDERGGREYNLALGQRRAEAVSRALVLLGAADGQIEAVSFGKERPAVVGDDEAAWAKNRRAELTLR